MGEQSSNNMLDISSIMGNSLVKSAAVDFGIQWTLWAIAALFKTEKFYDLAGKNNVI